MQNIAEHCNFRWKKNILKVRVRIRDRFRKFLKVKVRVRVRFPPARNGYSKLGLPNYKVLKVRGKFFLNLHKCLLPFFMNFFVCSIMTS